MLFNTSPFFIFLPIVFLLYWALGSQSYRWQNALLVLAGFFFYGWWDARFVALLAFSTGLDFSVGRLLAIIQHPRRRKIFFTLSVVINLGLLGVFKYYNFFTASAIVLLAKLGWAVHPSFLQVILPVGISFYTFHSLSYVIDVYHRRTEPTRDALAFFAFVSFFPLLVAGPIIRASALLPAFEAKRFFDHKQASDGLRQMLWGLFKKVAIADVCAHLIDPVFRDAGSYNAISLALAAVLFSFQIYGDFSGYSDIAIGCAKLFGFSLEPNFLYPYFSHGIGEFWHRWHRSLTSWFRDYVYFPLGGNRRGKVRTISNTLLVFLLSGLWHGASWTYICWGALHGLLSIPGIIFGWKKTENSWLAGSRPFALLKDLFRMITTFLLVTLAWILFRAATIRDALFFLKRLFSGDANGNTLLPGSSLPAMILILLGMEWMNKCNSHGLQNVGSISIAPVRWGIYTLLILLAFLFGGSPQTFIYFQF